MDPLAAYRQDMTRRGFLGPRRRGLGIGRAGVALGLRDAARSASPAASEALPGLPHFPPRAKRVIYLFQSGAPSQMDLFDYKPELDELQRHRAARLGAAGPAADGHDLAADEAFRSPPSRFVSRSTARAAPGSASCCRTPRASPTSCASSSRCTPRRSTTIRRSRSFRPGRNLPAGRASAPGCPTAWAARTRICRPSWP